MEDFTFEYNNVMYSSLGDVEDAVAEEIGQYMNNADPYASSHFESELEDVNVYYKNEYWGTLDEYIREYGT